MGFFDKYIAYRWLSSGSGNGGGGDSDVGIVLLIVGGAIAAVLLFVAGLRLLGELIYDTARPILMISPVISAMILSIILSGLLLIVSRYPSETAEDMLTGNFFGKYILVVGFMFTALAVTISLQITTGSSLISIQWGGQWVGGILTLIGNLVLGPAFFYSLYKLFHLPYRYHRLMQYAPAGNRYSMGMAFPLILLIAIVAFELPTPDLSLFGIELFAMFLFAGVIVGTYIAPIYIIRDRVKEHVLEDVTDDDTDVIEANPEDEWSPPSI